MFHYQLTDPSNALNSWQMNYFRELNSNFYLSRAMWKLSNLPVNPLKSNYRFVSEINYTDCFDGVTIYNI